MLFTSNKKPRISLQIFLIVSLFAYSKALLYKSPGYKKAEDKYLWISSKENLACANAMHSGENCERNVECRIFYLPKNPQITMPTYQVSHREFKKLIDKCDWNDETLSKTTSTFREKLKRLFRHLVLYPGTKWCGVGNRAQHYNELGPYHPHEDACCREHDMCPVFIEPDVCIESERMQSASDKYEEKAFYYKGHVEDGNNKTNDGNTEEFCNDTTLTMSHCDCDERFQHCLRQLNTSTAQTIGYLYFKVIGITCFTKSAANGRFYQHLLQFPTVDKNKVRLMKVLGEQILDLTSNFVQGIRNQFKGKST